MGVVVEVILYSIFVLIITTIIFYIPLLIVGVAHFLYKEYLSKKKIYGYIFCFIFCYLIVCLLAVATYCLMSDFDGAKSSTAIRTDVIYIFTAVATIFAPLILVFTFNSWKKQNLEESKVKAIGEIKGLMSKLYHITNKFLINNSLDSYLNGYDKQKIVEETEEWLRNFDDIRWDILEVLQKNYYYLNSNKAESDEIFRLFDETIEVSLSIDKALSQIKTEFRREVGEEQDSDPFIKIKRIYLVNPYSRTLKPILEKNSDLKEQLKKYSKEKIFDIYDNFDNYLNNILDQTYEK